MSIRKRPHRSATLPPRKKQRKCTAVIEEISFDASAREEYLTGFHKRKLQRIKHGKEIAAKREREDKLEARKALREERRRELEERLRAADEGLEKEKSDSEQEDEPEEGGRNQGDGNGNGSSVEREAPVDREDEYVDEDKFATVTVEAVEVSKDGMQKVHDDEEDDNAENVRVKNRHLSLQGSKDSAGRERRKVDATAKRKKKKFRYESKAQRSSTKQKQRLVKKAKAEKRRG